MLTLERITSRGVKLIASGFVGYLRELANKFLEDIAHLVVGRTIGLQLPMSSTNLQTTSQSRFDLSESCYLGINVKRLQDGAEAFSEKPLI